MTPLMKCAHFEMGVSNSETCIRHGRKEVLHWSLKWLCTNVSKGGHFRFNPNAVYYFLKTVKLLEERLTSKMTESPLSPSVGFTLLGTCMVDQFRVFTELNKDVTP